MIERTLMIIKPDAVKRNLVGAILERYERNRFKIVRAKLKHLTVGESEGFYAVHKARPFFKSLTTFMSSGPCLICVLEAENAITRNRELMGATDPKDAKPGTIRYEFAIDKEKNSVHGSDAPDTAKFEIGYFFKDIE